MATGLADKYTGLSKEHFTIVNNRYRAFLDTVNDVDVEPVKVFNPLSKKALDELELIRTISVDLQNKKDEDLKKAAQLKQEAEEAAEEAKKTNEEEKEAEKEGEKEE